MDRWHTFTRLAAPTDWRLAQKVKAGGGENGQVLLRPGAVLGPGAMLFLYGPFRRGATHTSPSNEAFDRQLRAQNPAWGVRDLEEVARYAAAYGFGPPETHDMLANNLSVVLRKREPHPLTD